MKLTSLKSVGVLAAAGALSLTSALAGPVAPPPAVSGGSVPPPPINDGGGLWDKVGMTLSAGYDTDYIFRGYDIGHDFVWTQLDFAYQISEQLEFSVGAWYTTAFNDDGNELDLYGAFSYDFGNVQVSVGLTHYDYPNGFLGDGSSNGGETNEVFASVGTTIGIVDVGLAYYYDFDLETSYIEAKAGTSFALCSNVSLDPSIGVSWVDGHDNNPGFDDEGWNHAFARVELPIKLTSSATLVPYVGVTYGLDVVDDFYKANGGPEDYFWGGVALKVSF